MKSLTLPASHPQACADPEGGKGVRIPWKITSFWVSLEINIRKKLDPLPLENSGSFEKYSFLCNKTIGPPLLTVK